MKTFEQVMMTTGNTRATATLMDSEARLLYNACLTVPMGGLVIEVGCQLGRSSSIISQLSYDIGYDSIHIDPYTRQPEWMKSWMEMMWNLGPQDHQRFTLMCMRTEQAQGVLSRIGEIDMAYIDGDHSKEGALIDFRLVGDKVRSGGMMAVHDYRPNAGPDYSFHGVVEAIDIYLASGNWEKVDQALEMGVWRRK